MRKLTGFIDTSQTACSANTAKTKASIAIGHIESPLDTAVGPVGFKGG